MGDMIDWERFAARVPLHCLVRHFYYRRPAILLEHYPHTGIEKYHENPHHVRTDGRYPSLQVQDCENIHPALACVSWPANVLEYLIDGEWLTYDQVMALP